jgi:uncharacterized membrane protein
MTLPEIVLPKIVLPFDIPVLLHPAVVHFLIAIPVVILLLEIMNLMMKKKAVGGVSFFLILLVVVAAIGAYFTGLTDGKEAFPALSEAAKSELGEHKLFGTYLLLGSAVLLFLKLLAMTGNKVLKGLYILVLIAFVVLMFKQGKEGGELVYEHGLNVQAVQALDDEIFDLKEELEEAKAVVPATPKVEVKPEAIKVETPTPQVEETAAVAEEVVATPVQSPVETTGVETVGTPAEAVESVVIPEQAVVIPPAEEIPTPQ